LTAKVREQRVDEGFTQRQPHVLHGQPALVKWVLSFYTAQAEFKLVGKNTAVGADTNIQYCWIGADTEHPILLDLPSMLHKLNFRPIGLSRIPNHTLTFTILVGGLPERQLT